MSKTIRISEEAWAELDRLAKVGRRTVSAQVDVLVLDAVSAGSGAKVTIAERRQVEDPTRFDKGPVHETVTDSAAPLRGSIRRARKPVQVSPELSTALDRLGVAKASGFVTPQCAKCWHPQSAHVDGTGRCNFGTGCPSGCRAFVAPPGEVF